MRSILLDYLLKTLAQALAGNSKTIVDHILNLALAAENSGWPGAQKFQWVKETFLLRFPRWKERAGWILDTIIQLLVAWLKRRQTPAA